MKAYIVRMISLVLLITLAGCTTIQTLEDPKLDKLKVGETATIFETSGRVTRMTVSSITRTTIKGQVQKDGTAISIPRVDIDYLVVKRVDFVKTAAAGAKGIAVA